MLRRQGADGGACNGDQVSFSALRDKRKCVGLKKCGKITISYVCEVREEEGLETLGG